MVTKEDKIKTYKFVAEPFHTDFSGRLTWGVLGNHLLNCASIHASEKGFGVKVVNGETYTWVLSRLIIELKDMPRSESHFSISTWVESVYKMFTDRNYSIQNEKGEKIGYARTIWAMISKDTRKSADLITMHGENITNYLCTDEECPIEKSSRIKLVNKTLADKVEVKYTDIDINGHTNSMKYIEHILNIFPLDKYEKGHISRLEMAYATESYFGDTLFIYKDEETEGVFNIEVMKNDKEVVCRCKIWFEK